MFKRLTHDELDQFAFGALLRYKESLKGPNTFQEYLESVPEKRRKMYDIFCQSCGEHKNKDVKMSKKRLEGKTSFGLVPNEILNLLLNKSNRKNRAVGAEMLKNELAHN